MVLARLRGGDSRRRGAPPALPPRRDALRVRLEVQLDGDQRGPERRPVLVHFLVRQRQPRGRRAALSQVGLARHRQERRLLRGATQRVRDAAEARARGPSHPVHVRLQVRRRVVRHNGANAVDVQPARRGVRRDQHPRVAGGERAQRLGARGLRRERAVLGETKPAARGIRRRVARALALVPSPLRGVHGREQQEQPVRRLHGRGEHDHGRVPRPLQQRAQRERLRVARSDGHHRLGQPLGQEVPRRGRRRRAVRRGGEHARRVQEQPGESRGVPRERRGDEDLLQPAARGAQLADGGPRPPRAGGGHHLRRPVLVRLPQDAVRLVDDQVLKPGQGEPRLCFAQVRDEATRGGHQHVELIVRARGPIVESGLEDCLRGGGVCASGRSPPGPVIDPDVQADRPAEGLEHPRHLKRQVAGGHDDERTKPRRGLLTR